MWPDIRSLTFAVVMDLNPLTSESFSYTLRGQPAATCIPAWAGYRGAFHRRDRPGF
jgi:hypothetical protein